MHLLKTICSTDWKGRPTHLVAVLGTGTIDELVAKMDQDVLDWMATDIAADEYNTLCDDGKEPPAGWDLKRASELRNDPKLEDMWSELDSIRWEMEPNTPDQRHREFVLYQSEGDTSTLVYHFIEL